jgi:hypothetical protein
VDEIIDVRSDERMLNRLSFRHQLRFP